jgi:hypothetical protein
MRRSTPLILLIFLFSAAFAQPAKLTDHLIAPRLDSSYWQQDFDALNAKRSTIANRCESCVWNETDSTRGRFCFNTSSGQVQLDTTLHNFDPARLVGQWNVINFGLFETTDSIPFGSKIYYRRQRILKEQQDPNGSITFTAHRLKPHLENIGEIENVNKRYKILDNRYLATRTSSDFCGATIIGITQDDVLILDDHIYKTLGKKGKYFTMKTSIRRIMLKKMLQVN